MTGNNEINEQDKPKKKISLNEIIKRQLEAKKNQSADNNAKGNPGNAAKKMHSQQSKKVSSARRKMGS